MSSSMRSKSSSSGGSGSASPMDMMNDPAAMDSFMNDPQMMKAAEDMMKNMDPEMLASMAKAQGMDLPEGQAQMFSKLMPYLPYILRCYRMFGKVRNVGRYIMSPQGRVVTAFSV